MNSKKLYFISFMLMGTLFLSGCQLGESSSAQVDLNQNFNEKVVDYQDNNQSEVNDSKNNNVNLIAVEGSALDTSELFTDKDMEQSADLSDASYITLSSNKDVTIDEEGVYVLSGTVENTTVVIEVDDEDKVQLVLDGVNITNDDTPAIYVKSADKVFITLTDSSNYMEVSSNYQPDGDTNLDAVIFSKDDLVLNGTGSLEVVSTRGNGITSKDDLKVTGGTYSITSLDDSLEANDSILIAGGNITIKSNKDGLHSENEDDYSLGYVYMSGGTLNISAADDGIRGTSVVQIDGGTINIATSTEGIEATYIQINGGEVDVYATDDGLNASRKSNAYDVMIEINGGTMDVEVQGNDVDAFDSNGNIVINGGTINAVCPTQGPSGCFDPQGTATLNSGTVTVNGEVITEITVEGMGPGGGMPGGGFPGDRGGRMR